MSTKWQRFKLDLEGFSPTQREAIALDVIDKIIDRSKAGKDKNGDPFPKYSKEYKGSLNFKVAGKSSSVNLTLTGDMLDSIKILSNTSGKVLIGYENGSDENAKADGNIRGTYGSSTPDKSRARDFLGISEADLDKILSRYRKEERAEKRILREQEAGRLSGAVDTEDLEDGDEGD